MGRIRDINTSLLRERENLCNFVGELYLSSINHYEEGIATRFRCP